MPEELGMCNAFWDRCQYRAVVVIVAKDGGYFGKLCNDHADELERNFTRGKADNEQRYPQGPRD